MQKLPDLTENGLAEGVKSVYFIVHSFINHQH